MITIIMIAAAAFGFAITMLSNLVSIEPGERSHLHEPDLYH